MTVARSRYRPRHCARRRFPALALPGRSSAAPVSVAPASDEAAIAPAAVAPARAGRRTVVVLLALGLAGAAAAVLPVEHANATSATYTTAHDPIGSVSSVTAMSGNRALVKGWALDPDARTSRVTVAVLRSGSKAVASAPTSVANAAVTKKYHAGSTPGFAMVVPLPSGKHPMCVVVRNVGKGMDKVARCFATPVGRALTSAQQAKRSPHGAIVASWANPHQVHLKGWATDPDYVSRRGVVTLYLDGHRARTVSTGAYQGKRPQFAGPNSWFDILQPTSFVGTHMACLWIVNVGFGHNTSLGCKALDNRSPGTTAVRYTAPSALNAKVYAEAKKHIGQPYVWGAIGPKRFDCSGLVMYSYKKFGYQTPRVSEDQVKAARLIPASHARAGDLVFYHDSVGDVYHVGVFAKPGLSVAAIDVGEGVDYQKLWDPTVTYGSFTHT